MNTFCIGCEKPLTEEDQQNETVTLGMYAEGKLCNTCLDSCDNPSGYCSLSCQLSGYCDGSC